MGSCGSVKLYFILLFSFLCSNTSSEKSLFDDVPLSGALDLSTMDSNHVTEKVPRPRESTIRGKHRLQSTNKYSHSPTTSSLFDTLPNHGALLPLNPSKRNPRDSFDYEITAVAPTKEFELPFWDNRLVNPILKSVSKPPPRRPPPPPSTRVSLFLSSPGAPHPPPRMFNSVPRPPSHQVTHPKTSDLHRPGWSQSEKSRNKTYHVSANSGGPTVIVYAQPNKNKDSETNSGSSEDDGEYPNLSQSKPPVKNEIHYHYHMNDQRMEKGPHPPRYGRRPPYPRKPALQYGPPRVSHNPGPYRHSNTYHNSKTDENFHSRDEREDEFSSRAFFTSGKASKRPADTVSITQPSTSYKIPPPSNSFNSPSSQYGPPEQQFNEPSPSYGPPTFPPAPPPAVADDQQQASDQYETTITLQTIPVTRQVTELVQVPNVVHKISSNRPSAVSAVEQSDDSGDVLKPPSQVYGPPAPPPPRQTKVTTKPTRARKPVERPFDTHLSQILGVGPTQNPKDTVLQELLLNQARRPSFDLSLSDLELLSLAEGRRPSIGSSFSSPTFPILSPGRGSGMLGGLFQNLQNPFSRTPSFGNSDGLGNLREAFREQRFQLALADLRKQLREQNRDNVRERSSYRSLFTKGALLLSALTLLPSIVSPMASAAGVGTAASTLTNYMLPVTAAGRRKRSIDHSCLDTKSIENSIGYNKWVQCALKIVQDKAQTNSILPRRQRLTNMTQCIERDICISLNTLSDVKPFLLQALKLAFRDIREGEVALEKLQMTANCDAFICNGKQYEFVM